MCPSPCGLSPNCGCPTGQGCSLNSSHKIACEPAGSVAAGGSCTDNSQCAPGTICIGNGSAGECVAFCSTDADCPSGALCAGELAGSGGKAIPGVLTCGAACDPVAKTGCAAGMTCRPNYNTDQKRQFLYCDPAGKQGNYTFCGTSQDCKSGEWCSYDNFDGTDECHQFCYPSSASCNCQTITDPAGKTVKVNGMTLGECQ